MKKLKKETIIQELFIIVAQKCLEQNLKDTEDVFVSFSTFTEYLKDKYNISYSSTTHLYNQLKVYEKEHSLQLIDKKDDKGIVINLNNYSDFKQRIFLNKNIKIMLSNGALDLIKKQIYIKPPMHIYLGTGTECYFLAQLIFQTWKDEIHIYTHNLAIIQLYCEYEEYIDNIIIHTRTGIIDKITLALIDEPNDNFLETTFDAVVQSPRYIKNETCYVLSPIERKLKRNIAENSMGMKIVLLTLFEFLLPSEKEINNLFAFSKIKDYDYVIVPSREINTTLHSLYIDKLPLEQYIKYFSYEIFNVVKT